VRFAAITLCVASQRVFIVVVSLSTQSGNFWIHLRTKTEMLLWKSVCIPSKVFSFSINVVYISVV
jgi:hypothetical protein